MSCLIVPSPRFTLPVERSTIPMYPATSWTASGVRMQGAVVISTSGIPRRSREKVSPSTRCAASSSRHIVSIRQPSGRAPESPTSAVRWNPLVFEPSMTSFLMVWTCSAGVMPSIFAIVRQTSSASGFIGVGGSSSCSTRQTES